MPLGITVVTNNFGRVVPNKQLHVVTVGFAITGAVSGTPTFQKSLDNTNWVAFNEGNFNYNLDGYTAEFVLPSGVYNFYVREVGQPGDVASSLNYALTADISTQGLHPLGNTPKIMNDQVVDGNNITVGVETSTAGEYVKIYSSTVVSNQEVFDFPYIPVAEGISDTNKIFRGSLTLRAGQKICASSQGEFDLESYSVNAITVGETSNNKKLNVTVALGAATGSGRNVTVSAVGGSNDFSVSKSITTGFNLAVNTPFELLFGRQFIAVKDNITGAVYSKAVHILPGTQATIDEIDLRAYVNITNNIHLAGTWKYGSINNNVFTLFDSYGVRADGKEGWGNSTNQLPMIGFGNTANPLASDSLVFCPYFASNDSANYKQAAAIYVFAGAGLFSTTKIRIKKAKISNAGSLNYFSKYIIKLNDTILLEGVLNQEGQTVDLSIVDLPVQTNDLLKIIIDEASISDGNTTSTFDDVHVSFVGQLRTSSYTAPSAPNAPTLVAGSGASTSEIVQGTTIDLRTTPQENWIAVKRNNSPLTFVKTINSGNFNYIFKGGVVGNITIRSVAQGVYSSAAPLAFIVKSSGAVAPVAPAVESTTGTVGMSNKITCPVTGKLIVYLGGNQIAAITIASVNQQINYTYDVAGSYTFKIEKNGLLSVASATVVISAASSDCSLFVNTFALGTFTASNYALTVFVLGAKTLIKQVFNIPNAFIIRNGNFLDFNLVTSDYKGRRCFSNTSNNISSALGQADIGNIAGYKWMVTDDNTNTPYLIPDGAVDKSYRVAASTACEGETIKFAISATISNPSLIPDADFKVADGTIRVNIDNIEDPNASPKFYKIFTVPAGIYNVFYKVTNSPNTPVVVVNHNFQ